MPKARNILVVNTGSSSIKFAVFAPQTNRDPLRLFSGELEGIGTAPEFWAKDQNGKKIVEGPCKSAAEDTHGLLAEVVGWIEEHLGEGTLCAIGHRVATGGLTHTEPVIVTDKVLAHLQTLVPLAPLHLPRNLEPFEIFAKLHPGLPQIASFDTAFHATMPTVARHYGLPRNLTNEGAQRFGYHGISYEFIASQLPTIDPRAARGKTIVAHLGSGASMCALDNGKSIATTMGFSPLSGLMMATRPGELDPGLMIWLLREKGMDIDTIEHMLYHNCGLKGVSGLTSDMRALLHSKDPAASDAIALFVHRITIELGGLTAALGGLDALIFTAGIGEHAPEIRAAVCARAAWLGLHIDAERNKATEQRISADDSKINVWVIPTDEERVVAIHTAQLINSNNAT